MAQQDGLDGVFGRILTQRDSSIRSVARLSGVPRRTLENWLSGRTRRPRDWRALVRVALALRLNAAETNTMLRAAGHSSLAQLHATTGAADPDVTALWAQVTRFQETIPPESADLPSAVTPFVGRETAVAALETLLQQPQPRLITISGLGGVGKTRLALAVAERMQERFDGNVYFVPLDDVTTDDGFWVQTVSSCGIGVNGTSSAETIVRAFFRTRIALLVCDNFEQLVPHAAVLTRLLTHCPGLRVLVTSRFRLNLYAEQVFPLRGLQRSADARALFVQTARRRQPDYAPDSAELAAIEALCAALANMPLAIELAAGRIDVLAPAQMLATFTVDQAHLAQSSADRPPRQRSLTALFESTWQLLRPEEQAAALRLTLFKSAFSRPAALTVADLSPPTLQRLIDCSLLQRVDAQRLQMHDLLRRFLVKRATSDQVDGTVTETQFCRYYLNLLGELGGELRRTMQLAALQQLGAEWRHVEQAWELAIARGMVDQLGDCSNVVAYFEGCRQWHRGVRFLQRTMAQLPAEHLRARAGCEAGLALLSVRLYDVVSAEKHARQALALYEQVGAVHESGMAQMTLTIIDFALRRQSDTGNFAAALLASGAGSFQAFADLLPLLLDGAAACKRGDFEHAIRIHQRLLEAYGTDTYCYPVFNLMLGLSHLGNGDAGRARDLLEEAYRWAQRTKGLTTLVAAAFELSRLDNPDAPFTTHLHAVQAACRAYGPVAAGYAAIHNGVNYPSYGFGAAGRQLARIGLALLRPEVGQREMAAAALNVGKLLLAHGVVDHVPTWLLAGRRSTDVTIVVD